MMKRNKCFLLGILAILCLMPIKAFSQNLTVEGTVKDEAGEPLIGVSIIVQGQGVGAVTDFDGNFRIQSVKQGATLEFSYVGYLPQSLRASRSMTVTMQPGFHWVIPLSAWLRCLCSWIMVRSYWMDDIRMLLVLTSRPSRKRSMKASTSGRWLSGS